MTYLNTELDAIYKAYHEYEVALAKLQASCEHKTILESPRVPQVYFNDLPYIRICEDCGVQEESSWGSWKILTGRAYQVKRTGPNGAYSQRPYNTYIPDEARERLGLSSVETKEFSG